MQPITVEPELYKRVEKAAKERNTSVDDLLSQGIRYYLWELERQKISEETRIYRKRHPDLKQKYLGFYIAMINGEVMDHDKDFQKLNQRIRKRFGRKPVMIKKVEDEPDRPIIRSGFRFEESQK